MNKLLKILAIQLSFLLLFTFVACDGDSGGGDTNQAALDLNKTEITLSVGIPDTITATATTLSGTVDTISAESSSEAVATVSVSELIVTVTPLTTGTTTITVTSGSGIEKTCTVTVTTDATLNLDKAALSVNVGDTDTITATATTSSSSVDTISAESSSEAVATVSVSGLIVTVTPVITGTATITVTSGSGVEKTCIVTVTSVFLIVGDDDGDNVYIGKYSNDGTALAWADPTINRTSEGYESEVEYAYIDASKNVYLYVVFEDDADNVERYIYKYNSSGTKINEVEVSETESGYEVEEDYFTTDTAYILSVNHSTSSVRVRNFALSDFSEGTVSSGYGFTGEFHGVTMDSSGNIYVIADSIVKYTYGNTTAALTIDTSGDFDRVEHMVVRSDGTILAGGFIEYTGTGVENFWQYRSEDSEYWVLRKPALMLYNANGSDNWTSPLYVDAKSQEGLELLFSYYIQGNTLYLPVTYNNDAWSSIYENDGSNNFTVIPETVSSPSNETVCWKILKINLSDGTLDSGFTDISYTTDGTKSTLSMAFFSNQMNSLIVLENEDLDGSVNGSVAAYNSETGVYGSELIDAPGKAYWFFLDY